MEKEYKGIISELENYVPIENTIKTARNIEVLHNLIKNNGHNFDLSKNELELAQCF